MRTRRSGRLSSQFGCFLAATLLAGVARGGPPFITDDPEPVEKGHGELYFATQGTLTHDDVFTTLPHVEFNYGPIEDVQLHIIAPLALAHDRESNETHYGYGDTELGVKYRFIHEDQLFKGCPQVGIFPLVELPTGDERLGLGNGRAQEFIPIWIQKSFGEEKREWTVYGGGGYWFNQAKDGKDFGLFGVVLQKQVTDNLLLGGELLHVTQSAVGEPAHTAFNLGGVYDLSDHVHLLFSAGRDFSGGNEFTSYFALQFTF